MFENLDLLRSIYTAWSNDDYRSTAWADAEIELVKADGPDPGSWHGVREMSRVWTENWRSFEDFHTVADACRELDAERILVLSPAGDEARGVRWSSAEPRPRAQVSSSCVGERSRGWSSIGTAHRAFAESSA